MVRKIMVLACMLSLIFGLAVSAKAATHSIYDGNLSSSHITYFRDIVSGIGFDDDYIAFRSGQNEYILVVGQLEKTGNTVKAMDIVKTYTIDNVSSGYSSHYSYSVSSLSSFEVNLDDNIVYTNLGDYPELIERGDKYEMLSAVLMCIAMLGIVVSSFFRHR